MSSNVSISRQRILSVWLRRFSTDRLERQWRDGIIPSPKGEGDREGKRVAGWGNTETRRLTLPASSLREEPPSHCRGGIGVLVVSAKRANAEILVAVNDAAESLGLKPGLGLAEARAMHPDLIAVPEDASEDARLLEAIADWCARYTPLVACESLDGLLLDIGGCAHLFGGEEPLLKDLVAQLNRFGFAVRAAIADTIGAAWAAAHFSETHIVASGAERALLTSLPLAALRLPAETVTVLRRVGLKHAADIIDLPRSPLAARFGARLLQQLDRALGKEREPLTPRLPVPPYFTEQRFAEPIAHEDDVLGTIHRMASRLRPMLEARGEGVNRVELSLFRTDGAVYRLEVSMSRLVRDPAEIRALFVERLAALADPLDPGFGFDLARLSVLVSVPAPNEQIGLEQSENAADLAHLVDRLVARFGSHRIMCLVAHDSHLPELASLRIPFRTGGDKKEGWDSFRKHREKAELSPRPLRLLDKPEPIDAVAPLPDGPPLQFRWRRALHEIARADGPERIKSAWWSQGEKNSLTHDYFAVEDVNGQRFWLFRAGFYEEEPYLRWFMHGLFA